MPDAVALRQERLVRGLAIVLLAGAAVRLLASIVAGFVEWRHAAAPYTEPGRARAFDVLTTFGAAGDGAGLVLAVLPMLLVWWMSRGDDPLAATLRTAVSWILGLTALLAVLEAIGVGLLFSVFPNDQTSRIIGSSGFALAALVIAVGGAVLTGRLGVAIDDELAGDDIDAFVFALDRHSIDVRAFLSVREATRRMHVYAVEEEEFDFYTDEGEVLRAAVVDDRIELQPSGVENLADLLARLKEFAVRRGITIDEEDADDPTAYVDPINKWQWLEMWPPWLRPLGYVFRRR